MITFLDKLKTEEEKEEEFDKASMVTGSSGERTYFIANYTNGNAVQSNEVDLLALEILDSVLLFAEKFILVRKQREKNKMDREVMAKGRTFFREKNQITDSIPISRHSIPTQELNTALS